MEISTKELRIQPGRIISRVNQGLDVTITYKGKPAAKIIPIRKTETVNPENTEDELFGLWKDREDIGNVDQFVRSMRKGRKL
ncbi:MAG: type II toxin-antitoxin system prevent-host-death family antitoxin [Treponema sp.]|nr:type II toxin-antitoxin system prevent-host-death family antitoxin [Treponema sp.]